MMADKLNELYSNEILNDNAYHGKKFVFFFNAKNVLNS